MIKIKKKLFVLLALLMAFIVALSNYLVQFPINYFGLENLLTYGAFSYPVAFLITDLSNRRFGKKIARKIVYLGFVFGVLITLYFSTNFITSSKTRNITLKHRISTNRRGLLSYNFHKKKQKIHRNR